MIISSWIKSGKEVWQQQSRFDEICKTSKSTLVYFNSHLCLSTNLNYFNRCTIHDAWPLKLFTIIYSSQPCIVKLNHVFCYCFYRAIYPIRVPTVFIVNECGRYSDDISSRWIRMLPLWWALNLFCNVLFCIILTDIFINFISSFCHRNCVQMNFEIDYNFWKYAFLSYFSNYCWLM